jgi:hypothetical protein
MVTVQHIGVSGGHTALEERILARDQVGASEAFYELARARQPLDKIIAEAVRVRAPYTYVPYHHRIDDGYPNFVNNDHCLLGVAKTSASGGAFDRPGVALSIGLGWRFQSASGGAFDRAHVTEHSRARAADPASTRPALAGC